MCETQAKLKKKIGTTWVGSILLLVLCFAYVSCEIEDTNNVNSKDALTMKEFEKQSEEQSRIIMSGSVYAIEKVKNDATQLGIKTEQGFQTIYKKHMAQFLLDSCNNEGLSKEQILSMVDNVLNGVNKLSYNSKKISLASTDDIYSKYTDEQKVYIMQITSMLQDTNVTENVFLLQLDKLANRANSIQDLKERYVVLSFIAVTKESINFSQKLQDITLAYSNKVSIRLMSGFGDCFQRNWVWREFGTTVVSGALTSAYYGYRFGSSAGIMGGVLGAGDGLFSGGMVSGMAYAIKMSYVNCMAYMPKW